MRYPRITLTHLSGVLFAGAFALIVFHFFEPADYRQFGTKDLKSYWAATNLLAVGANPYRIQSLQAWWLASGNEGDISYVWNPPWTFLIFVPLAKLSLGTAAKYFLIFNILLVIPITILWCETLSYRSRSRTACLAAAFLFPPVWEVWEFGQISAVLLFAFIISFACWWSRRDFIAGCLAAILVAKCHLLLVFSIVPLWITIKERRFKFPIGGFCGLVMLSVLSELIFPGSMFTWLREQPNPIAFKSVTLVTAVREIEFALNGVFPDWPVIVIPVLGMLGLGSVLYFRRQEPLIDIIPFALALSLVVAPYGWMFDQVFLLPTFIDSVYRALNLKGSKRSSVILLILLGALCVIRAGARLYIQKQESYFWFAPAVMAVWLLAFALSQRRGLSANQEPLSGSDLASK